MSLFILGAISKLFAMITTYPVLAVRTTMQADKTSAKDTIMQIIEKEGVSAFFKGMQSKMLYTILNAGFTMTTQENLKHTVASMLGLRVRS